MANPDCNPQIDSSSDQVQKCGICNEKCSDGYCGDCEAYMCQTCFDRHLNIKSCRYHVLHADFEHQTVKKKTHDEPCKIHENMVIEFVCVDHRIVGCAKCILFDHSTCKREDIGVATKRFQDDGDDARLSQTMKQVDVTYNECMHRVQQLTQSVTAANDKTINDIEAFKASISSSIYETVGVALEKAEQLRLENETKIERFSEDLKKIRNSMGLLKDSLKSTEESEKLFIAAMDMEPKLVQYQKKLSTLKTENIITEYKFHPHKRVLDLINETRLLGEVLNESEELEAGNRMEGRGGRCAMQQSSPSHDAHSAQSVGQDNQEETQHNDPPISDRRWSTEDAPIVPRMSSTPPWSQGGAQSLYQGLKFAKGGPRTPLKYIEDNLNDIVQKKCDNEAVFDWIEGNVDEPTTKSKEFIRALMTSVCKSAIKGCRVELELEQTKIRIRNDLLQKYINQQAESELQALYAVQAFKTQLGHPFDRFRSGSLHQMSKPKKRQYKALIRKVFDTLYDEDIISEDSFFQWEKSEDETDGKTACLNQTRMFFTWLREAESDV